MNKILKTILIILIALVGASLPAAASYFPFNTNVNMNIGIGTSTPQGAFVVMNGNVGIGTWLPAASLDVENGNILLSNNAGISFRNAAGGVSGTNILSYTPGNTVAINQPLNGQGNPISFRVASNPVMQIVPTGSVSDLANIGIGTFSPVAALSIVGNVGIGTGINSSYITTTPPSGGMIIQGNVGIGSLAPGTALDVNGTVRTTGFTLSQNPSAGFVLVGNGVGVGTWMPANTLATTGSGQWTTTNINDVYETNGGNVGIGTTITNAGAALSVMNGNVGIGTWVPGSALFVNNGVVTSYNTLQASGEGFVAYAGNGKAIALQAGTANSNILYDNSGGFSFQAQSRANVLLGTSAATNVTMLIDTNGNVGIGTTAHVAGGLAVMNGNVGIGSLIPGTSLDVNGTVRMTGFTLSQNPSSGYVLVGNGVGVGTWMAANTLATAGSGQWTTINTNDVYETNGGNVGIGTTITNAGAALSVMNGNVGIGTWAPISQFQVGSVANSSFTVNSSGTAEAKEFEVIAGALGTGDVGTNQNAFQGLYPWDLSGNLTLNSTHSISLEGGNNANIVYITMTNAGNLGIGTLTPVSALAVVGNIGIGTGTNSSYVTTSPPNGGMIIQGNVGIGSLAPGTALDVNGTVRMTGLTLSQNPSAGYVLVGNGVGVGTWMAANTLATSAGTNYWLNDTTGNVGISTAYAVGIGTTFVGGTGEAALSIMNGNVGIGTWVPALPFSVTGDTYHNGNIGIGTTFVGGAGEGALTVMNGNVGIGTWVPGAALFVNTGTITSYNAIVANGEGILAYAGNGKAIAMQAGTASANLIYDNSGSFSFQALSRAQVLAGTSSAAGITMLIDKNGNVGIGTFVPNGQLIVIGNNVGIGSLAPGQELDVTGTVRTIGLTMSGQTPISGYVLTSSDSSGDATWSPPGAVGGWTVSGNNVYETSSGNVGIGTFNPFGGGLIVLPANTGNVGIGSLVPGQALDVQGTVRVRGEIINGNVGIGTSFVNGAGEAALTVMSGNVGIGTWLPVGALVVTSGNVGIGTDNSPDATLEITQVSGTPPFLISSTVTTSGDYLSVINGGNVGIGSTAPGKALDVQGTIRDLGEIVNGNVGIGTSALQTAFAVANGNVGIGTWTAGNNLSVVGSMGVGSATYANTAAPSNSIIVSGNIGIGTTTPQSSLSVMNGNVGIGTWTAGNSLSVIGGMGIGSATYANAAAPSNGIIVSGNVGIGTTTPQTSFVSMGNVGIGTWAAGGGNLIVLGGSNVGVGSAWPGVALDVNGTARMTGFVLTGNGAAPGSIMVTTAIGMGTWMPINTIAATGAIVSSVANEIGYYQAPSNSQTIVGSASMVFNNGNIGLGTQSPLATLQVVGNIGIGTVSNGDLFIMSSPTNGGMVIEGNVGIGTWAPTKPLSVIGDSYHNGNIGIGTTFIGGTGEGAMSVMNGNVGIGTWIPAYNLDLVNGSARERNVRRVNTEATGSPVTINTDQTDLYTITALAANLTFNDPTGTPRNGDLLEIRILDNGTARTLTWTAGAGGFASTTTTLPATTVINITLRVLLEYNSASSEWECIGVT